MRYPPRLFKTFRWELYEMSSFGGRCSATFVWSSAAPVTDQHSLNPGTPRQSRFSIVWSVPFAEKFFHSLSYPLIDEYIPARCGDRWRVGR